MKSRLKTFKKNLANDLELPDDIVLGATLLSVTGNYRVHIENAHGILEYTTEKVKLLTRDNTVEIEGKDLLIDNYSQEEINIEGSIDSIHYICRGRL